MYLISVKRHAPQLDPAVLVGGNQAEPGKTDND